MNFETCVHGSEIRPPEPRRGRSRLGRGGPRLRRETTDPVAGLQDLHRARCRRLDPARRRPVPAGAGLRLKDGEILAGRLDPASVEVETLRALRGRPAMVVGRVHFHADGTPRVLVARRIGERTEGGRVFEHLPRGSGPGVPLIPPD